MVTVGAPAGTVQTLAPWGRPYGVAWSLINRWDAQVCAAAAESGVPASRIKAHIVVESQGEPTAVQHNAQGSSFGLMQVVPTFWRSTVEGLAGRRFGSDAECGQAMLDDPALAVRAGAAVLKAFYKGSWDGASSAFFTGTQNWAGSDTVNGTKGKQYKAALDGLIGEIERAGAQGVTGVVTTARPGGLGANPFPTPVIYDVVNDATRFGLSVAEGQGLRANCWSDRQGRRPMAIVLHIQEGTTPGSLQYWARGGPDVKASASVMASRDGSIVRVVWDKDGPWTNGDVQGQNARVNALIARAGVTASPYLVNTVTLSIEAEGYWQQDATTPQVQAICWMVWEWMSRYGLTLDDVYRHSEFNSVSRANCPGTYYATVINALKVALGQGGTTAAPATTAPPRKFGNAPGWLTDAMVLDLFPEASPGGVRTEAWLTDARTNGTAPRRVKFHNAGTDAELIEFSDGSFLSKSGTWMGQG